MTERVVTMTTEQWSEYAEAAHKLCFSEARPREFDRSTFALMYVRDEIPYCYVSCHEMDKETVYLQFGGIFRAEQKMPYSFHGYQKMIEALSTRYLKATTSIENTNVAMLKPAMRIGFRIVGIRVFKEIVLLEHILNFGGFSA